MKSLLEIILLITLEASAAPVISQSFPNLIDLEVSESDLVIDCTDYPESKVSYLSFYVADGDGYYFFNYRRPRDTKQCHEEKADYMKIVKQHKTVHVVGVSPREQIPLTGYADAPKRFKDAKKIIRSTFVRLNAKDNCKAYFENDCKTLAPYDRAIKK